MDSVKASGFAVLFIGVAVLVFTFYNVYLLLIGVLAIPGSQDLMDLFGRALAPLIESAIRALYLGIMGWIGSILTRRGVQIITSEREEAKAKPKPKVEEQKEAKETQEAKEVQEVKEAAASDKKENKGSEETKSNESTK